MSTNDENGEKISRRILFQRAACAAAIPIIVAAATSGTASAGAKMSQSAAKYQGTPKGEQRCDGCALFQAPDGCKSVSGTIAPEGWCKLFVPKPK
jgi:hypothetical protein